MRRQILATAAALVCAGAFAAAQGQSNPGQQSNPAQPGDRAQAESRAGEQGTTTLTGCVYREENVPGRSPNIAERAGVLEDYILAVSMPSSGSRSAVGTSGQSRPGAAGQSGAAGQDRPEADAGAQARAGADADADRPEAGAQARAGAAQDRPSATGTSGSSAARTGSMFKLEHEDDDRLQAMVGKRVEVTGKIDAEAGDTQGPPSRAQGDQSIGPDQIELPEFEVASIREVAGDCPASPQAN